MSPLLVFVAEDSKIKHYESREIVVRSSEKKKKVRCHTKNPKQVGKQDVGFLESNQFSALPYMYDSVKCWCSRYLQKTYCLLCIAFLFKEHNRQVLSNSALKNTVFKSTSSSARQYSAVFCASYQIQVEVQFFLLPWPLRWGILHKFSGLWFSVV